MNGNPLSAVSKVNEASPIRGDGENTVRLHFLV